MRNKQDAIENAAAITLLQIVRLKTCTFIIQVPQHLLCLFLYYKFSRKTDYNYRVHVYDIVHLHVQFMQSILLWSES